MYFPKSNIRYDFDCSKFKSLTDELLWPREVFHSWRTPFTFSRHIWQHCTVVEIKTSNKVLHNFLAHFTLSSRFWIDRRISLTLFHEFQWHVWTLRNWFYLKRKIDDWSTFYFRENQCCQLLPSASLSK